MREHAHERLALVGWTRADHCRPAEQDRATQFRFANRRSIDALSADPQNISQLVLGDRMQSAEADARPIGTMRRARQRQIAQRTATYELYKQILRDLRLRKLAQLEGRFESAHRLADG